MRKRKTIACDRCGARIDRIPEKCPECGEEIRARMDPHIRERVEEIMKGPSILKSAIVIGVITGGLVALAFFGMCYWMSTLPACDSMVSLPLAFRPWWRWSNILPSIIIGAIAGIFAATITGVQMWFFD
jgi:DNA-directed RNA polymerase subunit RPC12/RpoP